MKLIEINEDNKNLYNNFIINHPYAGIWHDTSWLDFQLKSKKAYSGKIYVIEQNNEIILSFMILVYKTSLKIRYAYIPAGFLFTKLNDEIYNFFIDNLKIISKKFNFVYTQVDSIIPYTKDVVNVISNKKSHKLNIKLPIPSFTNIINLNLNEEELLTQMKPKGRYNIKLSEKKGLSVKIGNVNDIKDFYNILKVTGTRDGFNLNNLNYYEKMLEIIPYSKLISVYKDNKMLASGVFIFFNKQALYYYGASSDEMRNLMAPYLMQWTAIKLGKQSGCKYYDFMGVADPDDKNDRLAGVTEFKLKFGGEIIKFNPSYHIINKKLIYCIFIFLKKIFKKK